MTNHRIRLLPQLIAVLGVAVAALFAVTLSAQSANAATAEAPFDASRFFAWESETTGSGHVLGDLNLDAVHALSTGDGVTIAVLDNGFDLDDPSIAGRMVPGFDFVDGDSDPREAPNGVDEDLDGVTDEALGHGSYVADVIAQVAPDANIMPVRVLDAEGLGTVQDVVAGLEWASANGADIINISFGSTDDIAAVRQAIDALPADIMVVAAAGNAMDSTQRFPAAISRVTSVAAFDLTTNRVATFSNRGSWIDVSAPGADLRSNLTGRPSNLWSGTSAATPIVSANYALIKAVNPTMDAASLRRTLLDASHLERGSNRTNRGVVDLLQSLQGSRVIECVQEGESLMVSTQTWPSKVRIRQNGKTIATVSDVDLTGAEPVYSSAVAGQEYIALIWANGTSHTASCEGVDGSEEESNPPAPAPAKACVDGDWALVQTNQYGRLDVAFEIWNIGAIAPGIITDDVVAIGYEGLTADLQPVGAVPQSERFGGFDGSHDYFQATISYSSPFLQQIPVSEFKVTLFFAGMTKGIDVCFTPTFYQDYPRP